MNKKISELFDLDDEIVVGTGIGNELDPEEIREMTMKKIRADKTEKRKKLSRGAIAAIVAVACLALCGAAYAAGLFTRSFNWKGEVTGSSGPTEMTQDEMIEVRSQADAETLRNILDDRADRELVIVHDGGSSDFSHRSEQVGSIDELRAKLEAENSPFAVPFEIPSGYVLADGFVSYDSTGGYALVSTETRPDGLVVERYAAPEENDFISFFRLDYENEAGETLFIFARLSPGAAYEFSALSGDAAEALAVDGMDEALLLAGGGSATLHMLRYLDAPIDYVDPAEVAGGYDTDPYTEAYYYLYASSMDGEALTGMLKP